MSPHSPSSCSFFSGNYQPCFHLTSLYQLIYILRSLSSHVHSPDLDVAFRTRPFLSLASPHFPSLPQSVTQSVNNTHTSITFIRPPTRTCSLHPPIDSLPHPHELISFIQPHFTHRPHPYHSTYSHVSIYSPPRTHYEPIRSLTHLTHSTLSLFHPIFTFTLEPQTHLHTHHPTHSLTYLTPTYSLQPHPLMNLPSFSPFTH